MKNYLYIAAAASLVLASCSSDNEIINEAPAADNAGKVAVAFNNPYLASSTRADIVDISALQTKGFGVFAYEQGSILWNTYRSSNVYPNFFYNQQVKYSGSEWTYAPVKYFSNNQGAKHSFFVYAPYDEKINAIFSMAYDAPVVRYSAKDNYDLLWAQAITDKEKPGIAEKLSFQFKHALSKVSFDVAPFIDKVHADNGHEEQGNLATNTTITVRSVKFIGKVPSQGLLNLGNGEWILEATEEGAYEITNPITFNASSFTRQNLIENMMVIPTSSATEKVKIRVVYDVITTDAENPKNNSTVTNTITSNEEFELVKGTAYTFHLDLGLTSVKFTANVDGWDTTSTENVDIPNNNGGLAVIAYTSESSDPSDPVVGQVYFNTSGGSLFYKWNGSSWTVLPVTRLYSSIVKEGKVQTGSDASADASWTAPTDGAYYVYNATLYQWKN